MKRSLIFLLAAGPLFVFGQRLDQPPAFKAFEFPAPELLKRVPSRSPALPVQIIFTSGFTVREMRPDRMPCLVPLRMPEHMPVNLRGNADPLPNAMIRP